MGSKTSKVAGSTANVISTVEIVDHKDDIQDVNKTMKLIVGLLLVIVLLKVVRIYKRSVQRPRDQHHALENPTDSFLRYQETPPLEPVTQDMLNSQMHRLRTPRRMDTPSDRQFRTNERESSHQLHPEIDRNSSFQGP